MAASEEDWAEIRRRWESGLSVARCAEGFDTTGSTVSRRASAGGWVRDDGKARAAAIVVSEAVKARAGERWAQRRADLLDELVDDLFRVKAQLFSPTVRREAKVIGLGGGSQTVEIVDVETDQPTYAEQKAIATTFAILADKTLLLAGEATARTESGPIDRATAEAMVAKVRDELAERRAAQEAMAKAE